VSIQVTWLGHATVLLELDGVRLITDPLLRRHAGILRRRGPAPRPGSWGRLDAVLLSHLHLDHADLRSLRLLAGVPVLTAGPNARWVRRKGLLAPGAGAGAWTRIAGSDVEVRLVPATHHSRPMPHRPNAAVGHLVRGPSGVVWAAGDTALFPEMEELAGWAGGAVDLAVVPVGGWGPRLSAGHLDPEQAAVACRLAGARHAVPVHWGTLHLPGGRRRPRGWMDQGGPRFAAAVDPGCRALVLDPGESTTVPPEGGRRDG
jgi:L-ascorbate metabolism protein UlaG (beta-lactamase superfamily)